MGFSVSASTGIVFLAAFVAFGTLFTAGSNGYERVSNAHHDATDRALRQSNTDLQLDNVSYQNGVLSANVTNVGTTTLDVNETSVVVDNAVYTGTRTVVGVSGTSLWAPGETMRVTVSLPSRPSRFDLVSPNGVSVGGAV